MSDTELKIKLTDKEVRRACDGLTIAVRIQKNNPLFKYRVFLVNVADSSIFSSVFIESKEGLSTGAKDLLRWHDKLGGTNKMASKSRGRWWNKEQNRKKTQNEI